MQSALPSQRKAYLRAILLLRAVLGLGTRRLGELLGGKGEVILLCYNVGAVSTEKRGQGFLDTIEKEFPEIEVIRSDQHVGTTRDTDCQQRKTFSTALEQK